MTTKKARHASSEETLTKHGFVDAATKPQDVHVTIPHAAVAEAVANAAGPTGEPAAVTYRKGRDTIVVQEDGTWTHTQGNRPMSRGTADQLEPYLCEHGLGDVTKLGTPKEQEARKVAADALAAHGFPPPLTLDSPVYVLAGHEVTLDQAGGWKHTHDGKPAGEGSADKLDAHLTKALKKDK